MRSVRQRTSGRIRVRRWARRVGRHAIGVLAALLVALVLPAWAGFTGQTTNPGDTSSSCIQITYTGTLPAMVKLFGTTTGTGLDPYVNLTITRGTISSGSFGDCTNFTADATNYLGSGAGVIYAGTLQAFPDSYVPSTVYDKHSATVNEVWTTNEVHSYKLTTTVVDDNAAQNLNLTQAFTWQAANTTAYSDAILSDNPASYWKLDEAAGTTAADSAGSVNGTYTNGPVLRRERRQHRGVLRWD